MRADGELLYLVLPAKLGWSVNLGADTIAVYATSMEAREEALRRVAVAQAHGEAASLADYSHLRRPDDAEVDTRHH